MKTARCPPSGTALVFVLALEPVIEPVFKQELEQELESAPEQAGLDWHACPVLSLRSMMKNYSKVLLDSNLYVYAGNYNLNMSR